MIYSKMYCLLRENAKIIWSVRQKFVSLQTLLRGKKTFERGSIAQLVQSICLTSRGSQVRILLLPQNRDRMASVFFTHSCGLSFEEL